MNPAKKKFTKKFKSPSNLHEKSFINWSNLDRPRTKIIREFPSNLICVYFKGKSLLFFSKKSTFRPIFEKCQPSSVILKIVGATLQLD